MFVGKIRYLLSCDFSHVFEGKKKTHGFLNFKANVQPCWENWYPLVNLHSYGKSPFWMGKSNISMVIFNSKLLNYQRVCPILYGHYFGIFGGHPSSSFPCWSHHHFNAFQKIPAQLLTPLVIVMLAHIQYLNIYKPQSVAVFWRIICPIFLQTPICFTLNSSKNAQLPISISSTGLLWPG